MENKKKFELKLVKKSDGSMKSAIFIDEELLDWEVDINSLATAYKMGPEYFKVAQEDIERHFLDSVSEVLGRQVTVEDINEAKKTGYI